MGVSRWHGALHTYRGHSKTMGCTPLKTKMEAEHTLLGTGETWTQPTNSLGSSRVYIKMGFLCTITFHTALWNSVWQQSHWGWFANNIPPPVAHEPLQTQITYLVGGNIYTIHIYQVLPSDPSGCFKWLFQGLSDLYLILFGLSKGHLEEPGVYQKTNIYIHI